MTKKQRNLNYIEKVIGDFGTFSIGELELGESPVLKTVNKNQCDSIEKFDRKSCTVTSYVHEIVVVEYEVEYKDLKKGLLDEVVLVIEQYEAEQIKLYKRIAN